MNDKFQRGLRLKDDVNKYKCRVIQNQVKELKSKLVAAEESSNKSQQKAFGGGSNTAFGEVGFFGEGP